eukprot:TRINITY_DN1596_c0_g1_i2.p1 TRINITY_DN1596_c0_g1~~TRINITY_DN1596_c0_g1_i2.p1  ORF type:complete len:305 (+),score=66.36 TRINITY_DN1596_c0_g1_i2:51-965(+)
MNLRQSFTFGVFLLLACTIAFTKASRIELESKAKTSTEYTKLERAPATAPLELSFAFTMPEKAIKALQRTLLEVSDPLSKQYGQYLTVDQVTKLLSASSSKVEQLSNYLTNQGVKGPFELGLHGMVMNVAMSVEQAETILGTQFYEYCHSSYDRYCLYRAERYSVETSLANTIDFIGGVVHFPSLEYARAKKTSEPQSVDGNWQIGWTPRALRDLFNMSNASPKKGSGNRQGVASFLGQYYDEPDLQEFFTLFYQGGIGHSPSKVIGDQGILPGVEANLDVQYIMGTSDLVDTWVYSNAGMFFI